MNKLMLLAVVAAMLAAGCKKKKPEEGPMPTGSGQAMGGSGAMGSAMGSAGAGSAGSAGSGSAAEAKPMSGEDLAKRFQDCWGFFNDAKWDDFKSCYASDAVHEVPGGPMPPMTGADASLAEAKGFKDAMPDLKGENQLILVDGHTIVGVTLIHGTMTGTMKTPMGDLPATKNKVGLYTSQVVDGNDKGEATHEWEFVDLATMMGQMKPDAKHPVRAAVDKLAMPLETVIAKDDDAEKANKDVATKVMDAFNKHDAKAMGDLIADKVVWSEQANPKDWTSKKEIASNAQAFWKAFSDAKLSSDKQYAAGAYVATVGALTGTNDGDMPAMHMKKTGKSVNVPYLMIMKIDGGKVTNAWLFDQGLAFATQLGLMPAAAPAAPAGGGDKK